MQLFTYADSNTNHTDLGRQSTIFNCTEAGIKSKDINLNSPNTKCWGIHNETRAVGVDVIFSTNGTDSTYAILVNEALTSSANIAYQANTLAVTSSCQSMKVASNCSQTTKYWKVSVECGNGLSWDWEQFKINASINAGTPEDPIWPVSKSKSYNFSESSSTSVHLGLVLFTDAELTTYYQTAFKIWHTPSNLSSTLDPTFQGLFYTWAQPS